MSYFSLQLKDLLNNSIKNFKTSEIAECPKCHKPFVQTYSTGIYTENKTVEIFHYCKACKSSFITIYEDVPYNGLEGHLEHYIPSKIEPIYPPEADIPENVKILSPMFVKIFNQSTSAESHFLDEVAGMGYRKAVEFLVKDFCIYLHPNDKDKIEQLPVAQCISNYIEDTRIKTLATACVWLGNDATHYLKKHRDKDINDLKRFIKALIYFIDSRFLFDNAGILTTSR